MNREDLIPMQRKFVRAGSFTVGYFHGNIGQHHVVAVDAPHAIEESTSRCVLVSGRWRVVSMPAGEPPRPDYMAGDRNVDRPAITVAGIYVMECVEDNTFYLCLSRAGRDKRMRSRFISGSASFVVPQYGVLALGSGEVDAAVPGLTVRRSGAVNIYARNGAVTIMPLSHCVGIVGILPPP